MESQKTSVKSAKSAAAIAEICKGFDASKKLMLQQSMLGNELLNIVQQQQLQCVFQPIVDLTSKKTCAFEALIRGPFNSVLHHPLNLFNVAEEQGVLYELDTFARVSSIEAFSRQVKTDDDLHLFLNISINAVLNTSHQQGITIEALKAFGLPPEKVVIEITELQPVDNFDAFIAAINYYRSNGFKVAIDDLGSGYNGLRIWSEVRPDFVKIDRHFVSDIHLHDDKKAFMETMLTLANSTNTKVVAEGVESEEELDVLLEMGVELAQGYLFKKPEPLISPHIHYRWPETEVHKAVNHDEACVADIYFQHLTINSDMRVNEISELFLNHPELDYFPVVDSGVVQGMVWRRDLMDLLARKFGQELHSRKTIASVMDLNPVVVGSQTSLVELSRLVTDSNEFDVHDAFIVEQDGRYIGCCDVKNLLRKMTDLKVEMAQHANPLSGLPGNMPIQKKLNKLIQKNDRFMVMYIDVDNFKAFNDNYSFEEGDQVISLIAKILKEVIPEEQLLHGDSFIGHIGGDDFVTISLHADEYESWAQQILHRFKTEALGFYSEADRERGSILAINRDGEQQRFDLMTLSIGILLVNPQFFEHRQKLSSYATKAKKGAKAEGGNAYFVVDSEYLSELN